MTIEAGYRITPQLLKAAEIDRVLASLPTQIAKRSKAGARHLLGMPIVRELASDARMLTLAGELVGPSPRPFRATLFDKSSDANWLVVWHQDTALPLRHRVDAPGWGPWSTKAGVLYALRLQRRSSR